jgi:predicted  nucleic acid-binding Zn-ribbon protein
MHREFEHLTSRLSDAEDTEVSLLLELEPLEEVAELIRNEAHPLAQRRHELQGAVRELTASATDEQAHLRIAREQVAVGLPADVRRRYESALARSGVSGAALVERDRCDGCRITLAPLDRDRLRALDDGEFMACPSCGRLLLTC